MAVNKANKLSFPQGDIEQKSIEGLTKLGKYVQQNYEALIANFLTQFEQYCRKIISMQEAGKKGALGFIHFSVLRTNILVNRHKIRLDAYDENWYGDRVECSGEYDVQELYAGLEEFAAALEALKKRAYNHLSHRDAQRAIFEESNKYLLIVAELLRVGLCQAATTEWFQNIKREALFVVCLGGFQDKGDILYKEDSTRKDAKAVKQHWEAKRQPTYTYEICENLNLSEGDYVNIRLLFSSLPGCDFSGSSFKNALILGSNFKQTIMRNVNMENIVILDTDFSGAVLENINFQGAKLKHLSFVGSTLINVKFEGLLLAEELDFEQAKLVDTVIPEQQMSR